MARRKEKLLSMLSDQMTLLRTSLDSFYTGNFAESLRIATTIRILVHETGKSKPLLTQIRPNALDLQIPDHASDSRSEEEEIIRIAIGGRLGPGPTISPSVDLQAPYYFMSTIGSWWNRTVFTFPSRLGPQVIYKRKQVILILANREGGAHVDPDEDPDYVRLLLDQPLTFSFGGAKIKTPDLARFMAAQSGVEMLECLRRNFFPDSDSCSKWECGAPSDAVYFDQISVKRTRVASAFPRADIQITKRK